MAFISSKLQKLYSNHLDDRETFSKLGIFCPLLPSQSYASNTAVLPDINASTASLCDTER